MRTSILRAWPLPAIVALTMTLPHTAHAQKAERSQVGNASAQGAIYECPDGQAMVGLRQWRTDRLLSFSVLCVPLKATLGPLWSAADAAYTPAQALHLGGQRPESVAPSFETVCPYNYFVVGWHGETADYHQPGTPGLARPAGEEIRITDIQPVCRGPEEQFFVFPKGRLTGASPDKARFEVRWPTVLGCGVSQAAIGVRYAFEGNRDRAGGFEFLSLICNRVGNRPPGGADRPVQ